MFFYISDRIEISTHSLTRRLTQYRKNRLHQLRISTHSLTRRLTMSNKELSQLIRNFNSQPHKEAD